MHNRIRFNVLNFAFTIYFDFSFALIEKKIKYIEKKNHIHIDKIFNILKQKIKYIEETFFLKLCGKKTV